MTTHSWSRCWTCTGSSTHWPAAPFPVVGGQGIFASVDPREAARRRIPHTIPERQDQKDRRKAKGTRGGRPPGFDQAIYAKRNTVERGYLRLKQWRGIATRYDKHALTFLGGDPGHIVIHLIGLADTLLPPRVRWSALSMGEWGWLPGTWSYASGWHLGSRASGLQPSTALAVGQAVERCVGS